MKARVLAMIAFVCFVLSLAAQNSSNSTASVSVPPVIQFASVATDQSGAPLSGTVSISFSLYNNAQGGPALWSETQNVTLDSSGHYSVYLGLTQTNGVPATLFTTGEAHWLGVTITGQPEQPRVYLVSVPYAMKAGDAATVGGLPPSAFVLAAPPSAAVAAPAIAADASSENSAAPPNGAITGSGTVDFIPLWDTTSDIISSVLFQSGTGSTAKVGINTTTPASTLDIKGGSTVRGTLSLPATGTATATKGDNSQPINLAASTFNSSTSKAVARTFQWQAEPAGNDTSTPSGTLNLLFGQGSSKPAETGLHIAGNGQITFAAGQAFPGTGDGTVTSVATGTGLTGGPITSTGTLAIDPTVVPTLGASSNAFSGSITASSFNGSGAGLTNVNAATLNGFTSSAFAPAGSYATLGANTFTGNQTVTGSVSATGGFSIGSILFAYGSYSNSNVFLGFAGNTTMTGFDNTASGTYALTSNTGGYNNTVSGAHALYSNTTGSINTASGSLALTANTTGSNNTASGYQALAANTTGNANTALGTYAGQTADASNMTGSSNTLLGFAAFASTGTLSNAAAIGALAEVSENNALVLGSINGVNGATANTAVGIGTTKPAYSLDVYGTGHFTQAVTFGSPVTFATGQTFSGTGTITGVTAGTGLTGGGTSGGVTLNLASNTCASGTALSGLPFTCSPFATLGANTFTGNQTVNANVTAANVYANTTVSGAFVNADTSFDIGGIPFAFGSGSNTNAFLGFAGNSTMTGTQNTASGSQALVSNNTGSYNDASGAGALVLNNAGDYDTADGYVALRNNTSGNYNTASGGYALFYNTTGSNNTGIGYLATTDSSTTSLTNAAAIGAFADVAKSNALVLGSINGVNDATASVNVGIGTTSPASTLDVEGNLAAGTAPTLWLKNNAALQSGSTGNSVDIRFTPDGGGGVGTPNAYIRAQEDGSSAWGTSLQFATVPDGNTNGAAERMRITNGGNVGIGTTAPDTLFSVNGNADKPGGGSWGTFSDRRLKNLDGTFSSGLDQVLKLNPILYRYKADNAMGIHDREEHVGLVAQEVQKVIPEAVTENSKGYLLVNNDPIIWAMLNAIKEQQKQIAAQENQIKRQQRLVRAQSAAIRKQHRQLSLQQGELVQLRQKVGMLTTSLHSAERREKSSASSSLVGTDISASLRPGER